MSHVLVISIGPVQDFIAAARKTRDLWFGSHMLSEVSRAAAEALIGRAQLVFPALASDLPSPKAEGGEQPIANKIVALVADGAPSDAAQAAREAAQRRLEEYKGETLERLAKRASGLEIDEEAVNGQLKNFLEFYAAWWPVEGEEAYSHALRQAERLLAGRKALRDFAPNCGKAGVPKSSLDGGRESVLTKADKAAFPAVGIKRGEQLDGISLIKRVAEPKRFVSVSRVAADPLVRRLERDAPEALAALKNLAAELADTDLAQRFAGVKQYDAFPYDTQLFYGEPSPTEIKQLGLDEGAKQKSKKFHKIVRDTCKNLKLGEPPAYFAVLVADADRMGELIGDIKNPKDHHAFSSCLAKFATRAGEIVTKHQGAMVYSGGDDVLAFLPLDTVLQCADELRQTFATHLQDFAHGSTKPSLSCGVSIGHYGEHLKNLIDWARRAERAAKEAGRNSLAVHLHTRTAGEEFVGAAHSWDADPVASRWQRWTAMYLQDRMPSRAAFDLRNLARDFRGLQQDAGQVLADEMRRVLKRKKGEHGRQEMSAEDVEYLLSCARSNGDAAVDLRALDSLVNELLIARRLAETARIASAEGGEPR